MTEAELEQQFIEKLQGLKYAYRPDIRTRAALETNFREKFEQLNHVNLTESEFTRLLEQITTSDTFQAAKILRAKETLFRDDGTPLDYTLVNITGIGQDPKILVDIVFCPARQVSLESRTYSGS